MGSPAADTEGRLPVEAAGAVMTVLGPVPAASLGFCHSHEHLFVRGGQPSALNPDLRLDEPDRTARELLRFRACGGGCVVGAQPVGCGRMAEELAAASRLSGVKVIASTGFHKPEFYPEGHWIHTLPEERVLDIFLGEIRNGMYARADDCLPEDPIGARPGALKTAVGPDGLRGRTGALFAVAAECCLRAGVPILCHLEMGQYAVEVMDFLTRRGVPPGRVILCHLDRRLDDRERILRAADTGAWLELDTIGRFKYHGDEPEAELILELARRGFAGRVLLGLDTTRSRMKSYGGSIGLDYISAVFLPLLRRAGVPEETCGRFMVENPALAFTITAGKERMYVPTSLDEDSGHAHLL
jgi:predicted metal-dependent phosphotriesterase family hydrolase